VAQNEACVMVAVNDGLRGLTMMIHCMPISADCGVHLNDCFAHCVWLKLRHAH
jgi:hypothetical protein